MPQVSSGDRMYGVQGCPALGHVLRSSSLHSVKYTLDRDVTHFEACVAAGVGERRGTVTKTCCSCWGHPSGVQADFAFLVRQSQPLAH